LRVHRRDGFTLHTQWNNVSSRKDTPAKDTVPTAKGITITIFAATLQAGVINISQKRQAMSVSKKSEANEQGKQQMVGLERRRAFSCVHI
jgi:hypothetical protein